MEAQCARIPRSVTQDHYTQLWRTRFIDGSNGRRMGRTIPVCAASFDEVPCFFKAQSQIVIICRLAS